MLVFDTETGSLDSKTGGLCSVTMKVTNMPDEIKTWFIKPQPKLEYTPKSLEKNGLTLEYLEEYGISEKECIGEIVSFISKNFPFEKPISLGQSIDFDIRFLNELFIRNNMHSFDSMLHWKRVDVRDRTDFLRDCGCELEDSKLTSAYKFFTGKELEDAHTSHADVVATEELYKAQINYVNKKD